MSIVVSLLASLAIADSHTKPYDEGESIILWVNKVGPFRNPQEVYPFYSLPFCPGDRHLETHAESLGEALQGYDLRSSPLTFAFRRDVPVTTVCRKHLTGDEVEAFEHAVENAFWYQMFMDDLPVWGMVGQVSEPPQEEPLLFTHTTFAISYNGPHVIEVNLTSDNPVPLSTEQPIDFTYSVTWHATSTKYEERFDKYLDDNFFKHQIHWFSVFNSFMMVIFLVGLVAMILMRTLNRDYARYARDEEGGTGMLDDDDMPDESGWKQVHGDVFRAPRRLVVFSALIGTGYQLAILVFLLIIFSIVGTYYVKRGTVVSVFVFFYALTSFIAGYAGGGFYARAGGKLWITNMLIIAGLFPGLILTLGFLLNFVAIAYHSLAAIPIGSMAVLLCIWLFISFPLTVVGTIIGKNYDGRPDNPCRVNPVPRHIPPQEWYMHPIIYTLLGGVLPFGSLFIELYFVFTAFWHYKYYYVYGFMLLVYGILLIVTLCVTIVSTYFLLSAEDYRWHWNAFLSAASTAFYVFLYSIYYFVAKTNMSGLFQTTFYFGYMLMFCIGLGILTGAVGFIGASLFVHRIYSQVKLD